MLQVFYNLNELPGAVEKIVALKAKKAVQARRGGDALCKLPPPLSSLLATSSSAPDQPSLAHESSAAADERRRRCLPVSFRQAIAEALDANKLAAAAGAASGQSGPGAALRIGMPPAGNMSKWQETLWQRLSAALDKARGPFLRPRAPLKMRRDRRLTSSSRVGPAALLMARALSCGALFRFRRCTRAPSPCGISSAWSPRSATL